MPTYKDDLDLIEDKKKDSKKLTLNALNAASDLGLDPTYGGDGSGEGGESDRPWSIHGTFILYTEGDDYVLYPYIVDGVGRVMALYPDREVSPTIAEDDIAIGENGALIELIFGNVYDQPTSDWFSLEGDIVLNSINDGGAEFIATGDFTLIYEPNYDTLEPELH